MSHMPNIRPVLSEVSVSASYEQYVNPQWAALLNLLDRNVEYGQCLGCGLFTKDGRRILDFLSGYCVHNAGHNHAHIINALKREVEKNGPAMLQSHVPAVAGDLGERLCRLAGGGLAKVFFGSSGSEGLRPRSNLRAPRPGDQALFMPPEASTA